MGRGAFGVSPPPLQPPQQPAGPGNEINVANELRAAPPTLEDDLAAMECFELRTMADADYGRLFELG